MSDGPRVLVCGAVLGQPMGGVRRHNAELLPRVAARLEARGGSLAVLVGREGLAFELPESVERIPSDVPAGPPLRRATREGRELERALSQARAAGWPFDLVHTAHLPAPQRPGVPLALTIHDLRSLDLPHAPMVRRLLAGGIVGRALRRAAVVVTVSEAMRTRLITGWKLPPWKVHRVPNAADHLTPLPRAAGPAAPLLHVGHVEPRKNLALLVRALAADPGLPPVVLAGRVVGDEGARLERLADELGVRARIALRGPFEDAELPALYAGAACVVVPSLVEGFGIPALEAALAGVPLAVAATPPLVETAGSDVPSFAPDDPQGCARAVRAALASPAPVLAERSARAARLSWDGSADAWLAAWLAALEA